jgi:uncharacterized membrane protein
MVVRTPRNLVFLSALFVVAGIMHFVIPSAYVGITPGWVPMRLAVVYLTGVAEIAGGIGLLVRQTRRTAGLALIILLVAVFPANIQMLSTAMSSGASDFYRALLFLRLPLQPALIVWIYRSAISPAR